jgi:hypothetical protein
MTKEELIVKQQLKLEDFRAELKDLKKRINKANSIMTCISGPLNGNRLGYTKEQRADFFSIQRELGL